MPELFLGRHEYIRYLCLLREYRKMGYDVDRIDVGGENEQPGNEMTRASQDTGNESLALALLCGYP